MTRPRLLDLFCCEGGAAMGYHRAGFDVVGVDQYPQPLYPFEFVQADALSVVDMLPNFDAVHASPPCQYWSTSTASTGHPDDHPDLIRPVAAMLHTSGLPYVIENVIGSPLRRDVMLCGTMFGLQVYRHRVFELGGWFTLSNMTCRHRPDVPTIDVTGHAGGRQQTVRPGFPIKYYDADHAREVMGMPWASGYGCTQAIPPAYTEWIGSQLLDAIRPQAVA